MTGSADVNTGQVDTTGDQTYDGGVVLGSGADLSGGGVTFGSTVGTRSGGDLVVSGNAVFDGAISTPGVLGGVVVTGSTDLNAGIALASSFRFGGPVSLSGGSDELDAPEVLFGSTVDGAASLMIDGGRVEFDGRVGGSTALKSLDVGGSAASDHLISCRRAALRRMAGR